MEDLRTTVSTPVGYLESSVLNPCQGFVFRHTACGPPSRGLHKYYDLQHELGKGSFATVMKALHKEEGKWYAVKMIQANKLRRGLSHASENGVQSSDKDKGNNFAREINILERLQHKNICQLKEVFFESYSISKFIPTCAHTSPVSLVESQTSSWSGYLAVTCLTTFSGEKDCVSPSSFHVVRILTGGVEEPEAQYLTYQICDALAVSTGLSSSTSLYSHPPSTVCA